MARLRDLFEELDFQEVETFIASGNVLFETNARSVTKLEARISEHLEASLGYPVDTFIRSFDEVDEISRLDIFKEQGAEGVTIHVGFLHKELPTDTAAKLLSVRSDVDELRLVGREYWWLCRVRTSESTFWTRPEVRQLRFPTSTMRNLTSIRKLAAKHRR